MEFLRGKAHTAEFKVDSFLGSFHAFWIYRALMTLMSCQLCAMIIREGVLLLKVVEEALEIFN